MIKTCDVSSDALSICFPQLTQPEAQIHASRTYRPLRSYLLSPPSTITSKTLQSSRRPLVEAPRKTPKMYIQRLGPRFYSPSYASNQPSDSHRQGQELFYIAGLIFGIFVLLLSCSVIKAYCNRRRTLSSSECHSKWYENEN